MRQVKNVVGKVAVWLCVVLLLVGCAAPAPAAPTATPGPTAEATPEPTPEPTPTAEEQPVRDWAQDVWIEGGALQENTLVSRGGTIYAYLGGEGALYAFDRETGAKSLCLHQGLAGRQSLYYLHEKDGLLYAAGLRGSGGFAWADPATGESGAAGFFPVILSGA